MKIDWKRKLTSRKLWMAVASFVSMLYVYFGHADSEAQKIASLILAGAAVVGYVIGEGLADSSDNMIEPTAPEETSAPKEEE